MLGIVLGLLAALAFAAPAHAQQAATCASDSQLDYVCGADKPEDVLALPGTRWLISSGFAPGAGLKLVDGSARRFNRWYSGADEQLAWDRHRFPNCPDQLDPELFNARGLALRPLAPQRWQLLVVNHGGREAIEAFEIDTAQGDPRLRWIGCQPLPAGQVGNAVASFADGTILTTVLTRPGTSIGDFMLGRITGAVWQWRPGEPGFTMIAGTELPGNNGLEIDPDDLHFYVVAFGWHAVAVFDRRDTRQPSAVIPAPDFMPDNIHWTGGRLLLAGMRLDEPACGGLRKVVDGKADPMLCHRGWVVGELDLAHRRVATVAYGHPQPGFSGVSTAALSAGTLWLGSFQADRLAIVRDFQEPAP
ncbi:MAG: hypothetical protein RIQ99_1037 [Pseudomonadota bacterium]